MLVAPLTLRVLIEDILQAVCTKEWHLEDSESLALLANNGPAPCMGEEEVQFVS